MSLGPPSAIIGIRPIGTLIFFKEDYREGGVF